MDKFPDEIKYRFSWRPYQQRVLDELKRHFHDNRLHLIAPPGSGKTLIGLETLIRLDKPALVLAPTVNGCGIWREKFINFFMPPASEWPSWLSTDISNPGFLTITTYRELLAMCSKTPGSDNSPAFFDVLAMHKVGTLVFDEAQHVSLKEWKCLMGLKGFFESVFTVSLASAPAFDMPLTEWERYLELSGPLDEEISIPELIREGDLCPHQDLVYFSIPTSKEQDRILDYRMKTAAFYVEFLQDRNFFQVLQSHPWVVEPAAHAKLIFENLDQAVNIAAYLTQSRRGNAKKLLAFIRLPANRLPKIDLARAEGFLAWLLFSGINEKERLSSALLSIQNKLTEISAIQTDHVCLRTNQVINQIASSSVSKLESIVEIVRLESENLGSGLKMIVNAEEKSLHVEGLGEKGADGSRGFELMGIFDKIRMANVPLMRIGIISGSGAVIPSGSEETLSRHCSQLSLNVDDLEIRPLTHDTSYIQVRFMESGIKDLATLIARVFREGGINVLIGPQDFLEEYFYTDHANALIMVNRDKYGKGSMGIRSCATRNSMGRAGKTADIWHLVCVDINNKHPGDDFDRLSTEFRAYMGPPLNGGMITNGISRLEIGKPVFTREKIAALNGTMMVAAYQRDNLRRRWFDALKINGDEGEVYESIRFRPFPFFRTPILGNGVLMSTIAALLAVYLKLVWKYENLVIHKLMVVWTVAQKQIQSSEKIDFRSLPPINFTRQETALCLLGIIFVAGFIFFLPRIIDAVTRMFRHITFKWSIRQVAQALLVALRRAGIISEKKKRMRVGVKSEKDGHVLCWLWNAGPFESGVFLDNFEEIVMPILSPRFILSYHNDYFFSVPPIFSSDKDTAMVFCRQWRFRIIRMKVLDTNSDEGRRAIVLAKNCTRKYHTEPERVYFWG